MLTKYVTEFSSNELQTCMLRKVTLRLFQDRNSAEKQAFASENWTFRRIEISQNWKSQISEKKLNFPTMHFHDHIYERI